MNILIVGSGDSISSLLVANLIQKFKDTHTVFVHDPRSRPKIKQVVNDGISFDNLNLSLSELDIAMINSVHHRVNVAEHFDYNPSLTNNMRKPDFLETRREKRSKKSRRGKFPIYYKKKHY